MPKQSATAIKKALEAYRQRSPQGYEDLTEYAICVADELSRIQSEDADLAPDDLEEMFADPPEYECADTMGIVHFMLGYVQGTAEVLGIAPWDVVRVIVGE